MWYFLCCLTSDLQRSVKCNADKQILQYYTLSAGSVIQPFCCAYLPQIAHFLSPCLLLLPRPLRSRFPRLNPAIISWCWLSCIQSHLCSKASLVGSSPLMGHWLGSDSWDDPFFLSCYLFIKACLRLPWLKDQRLCLHVCHNSWESSQQVLFSQ